jgi:membrane protein implicated in regulation of membrane protease activity
VTDLTADQVVDRCRSYWLESGVSTTATDEMAAELAAHLADAWSAGKTIEAVTGPDIEEFAEEWASAFRGPKPTMPPARPEGQRQPTSPTLPRSDSRAPGWALWVGILGIAAVVALVAILAPRDESFDQTVWVGLWLVAAALLAVGEMLTAGFFLLPFAIGAAAAGILALATVSVPIQIITFVAVSVASLFLLQQFAKKDLHGELLPVGAARYVGSSAMVIEPVSRIRGTGWVKMGTEDWRATTDSNTEIPANIEVRVIEVRGARLVVEPVDR